jgi:hypothetical protein
MLDMNAPRDSILAQIDKLKRLYPRQIRSMVELARTLDGQPHFKYEDENCTHREFVCLDCGQLIGRSGPKNNHPHSRLPRTRPNADTNT